MEGSSAPCILRTSHHIRHSRTHMGSRDAPRILRKHIHIKCFLRAWLTQVHMHPMHRAHVGQPCAHVTSYAPCKGQQQPAAAMPRASAEMQRVQKWTANRCRNLQAAHSMRGSAKNTHVSILCVPVKHRVAHAQQLVGSAHPDAAAESSCAQYSAAQAAVPVKKMWSRVASACGTSAALAAAHNAAAPAAPALAPPAACSNRPSQCHACA